MNQAESQQLDDLFHRAADLPPELRDRFVEDNCGSNPALREQLVRLLRSDAEAAGGFLQAAVAGDVGGARASSECPTQIANYRIIETLGEGGFGTVYKAEQSEPIRRTLALKVIKPGMDTRQVIARFAAERQALAVMDHPNVARVFDAGETESGRPYFVMELVDGIPVTRYCDEHRLPARARLDLFVRVCNAVQHAHQKGIMHRDIKPSNVLVTVHDGQPSPKLIDFGIARALDPGASGIDGRTLITEQGQLIGTPDYMSPEQIAGQRDIDTRTDIFSLGVLLYELLTGTTPLDRVNAGSLAGAGAGQLQRLICEQEPPTPSARLKTLGERGVAIAGQRQTDPATLRRLLHGDLDWIVMKALEKDRERRYETAAALAADIGRYLDDEPVAARPPTVSYRFAKFARRNRAALLTCAAVGAALVAGVIGTGLGLVRSMRAERQARAVNDFLNDDLLAAVSPDELGSDVSMRKVIEVASQRVEGKFADQPQVEAAIRLTLGTTFRKLADLPNAQRHLDRSRELRLRVLGREDPATLEATHELAHVHVGQDRYPQAESLFREAYEGRKRRLGTSHPDTISSQYELAVAIGEQGRYAETELLMTEALDLCRRVLGSRDPLTLTVIRGVGVLYWSQEQPDKAGPFYEEGYRLSFAALGSEHPTTLICMKDLASFYQVSGNFAEAERLLSQALPISQRVRGEEHPATLKLMSAMARLCQETGRTREAVDLQTRAIDIAVRTLPQDHSVTTDLRMLLAMMHNEQRRFELAEPILIECIGSFERTLGPTHPTTLRAIAILIEHFEQTHQTDKAAAWRQRLPEPDSSHGH